MALTDREAKTRRVKDRLLLLPADIRPLKGQAEFLRGLLSQETQNPANLRRLKGLTVVVAGSCESNQTYCSEVVQLTQQVNNEGELNVVIADQLKDEELAQLYAAALGVVVYSKIDCNPRAVFEGFVTDTPFFVTEKARLPPLAQHLGHISDGHVPRLAEQLADFVEYCEAGGFSGRPRKFAREHLVESEIYRRMLEWMDRKYVAGKVLDPVIRSEDALNGALGGVGGLGALLGGSGLAGLAGAGGMASQAAGGTDGGRGGISFGSGADAGRGAR